MKPVIAYAAAAAAVLFAASPALAAAPGNKGVPGPDAPRAAVGDLGMTVMSAVLNADGTLARGEGVVSAGSAGFTGEYEVIFGRDVTACAYKASIGSSATSGVESPGYATVVGRVGQPNGVFVATLDTAGDNANRGFHLLVYCGR